MKNYEVYGTRNMKMLKMFIVHGPVMSDCMGMRPMTSSRSGTLRPSAYRLRLGIQSRLHLDIPIWWGRIPIPSP